MSNKQVAISMLRSIPCDQIASIIVSVLQFVINMIILLLDEEVSETVVETVTTETVVETVEYAHCNLTEYAHCNLVTYANCNLTEYAHCSLVEYANCDLTQYASSTLVVDCLSIILVNNTTRTYREAFEARGVITTVKATATVIDPVSDEYLTKVVSALDKKIYGDRKGCFPAGKELTKADKKFIKNAKTWADKLAAQRLLLDDVFFKLNEGKQSWEIQSNHLPNIKSITEVITAHSNVLDMSVFSKTSIKEEIEIVSGINISETIMYVVNTGIKDASGNEERLLYIGEKYSLKAGEEYLEQLEKGCFYKEKAVTAAYHLYVMGTTTAKSGIVTQNRKNRLALDHYAQELKPFFRLTHDGSMSLNEDFFVKGF